MLLELAKDVLYAFGMLCVAVGIVALMYAGRNVEKDDNANR